MRDIELVFNNRDRLLDAFKLIALKVGVFLEGEIHVFLNADVVHDLSLIHIFHQSVLCDGTLILDNWIGDRERKPENDHIGKAFSFNADTCLLYTSRCV